MTRKSGGGKKNPHAHAGDTITWGSIPVLGKSLGGRNDNPFQYSCLENPIDRGAWQATVLGVTKSQTQLRTHVLLLLLRKPL